MGKSKSLSDSDEAISEINVVPLVDIVLVVLIIFMVTAPMIMKPALPIQLPEASSGESLTDKNLSITITTAGEVFLDGKKISDEELKSEAQKKLVSSPDVMAMISADLNATHGVVVRVMDLIKSSGINRIGISIDKKQ